MIKLATLSLSIAVLLTGCISLAPQYTDLPTVTIPEYLGQSDRDTTTIDISQISWRNYFTDPKLVELIEVALTNNSDMQLALLKVAEAYKQYGVEQSDRYPQINGQSSINYAGQNRDESGKNYKINATISFELDFFDRLKNLSQAQLARYLATQDAQHNTYILLVSQVAQAYLSQQIILKKITTANKQISNYRQAIQFIQSRIVSGQSTYLEYEQAKGMLESAISSRVELQQQQQVSHHTLQNLLNRYDLIIEPVTQITINSIVIPANLSSTVLLQRPDIMEAEHQLEASNADIGVARAAFFPAISLTGDIGNSSTALSDLLSGATLWDFVPKITLPIFNGDKNRLSLALANIHYQQSAIEYEKTIHFAFKEVADLLTLRQSYQQQFTLQQRYLKTQKNVLHLAEQGYLNGSSSYLDILDAQRNVFSTELTLLTLTQNILANEVNLFVALGGGWQA